MNNHTKTLSGEFERRSRSVEPTISGSRGWCFQTSGVSLCHASRTATCRAQGSRYSTGMLFCLIRLRLDRLAVLPKVIGYRGDPGQILYEAKAKYRPLPHLDGRRDCCAQSFSQRPVSCLSAAPISFRAALSDPSLPVTIILRRPCFRISKIRCYRISAANIAPNRCHQILTLHG